MGGLTKRDIQLLHDGGYYTVESVAYTPRRALEQIKGISDLKANRMITEGMLALVSLVADLISVPHSKVPC